MTTTEEQLNTFLGKAASFDPEGTGFDMETAIASGDTGDETGHFGSLDPRTGMLLKGMKHETIQKTIEAERRRGNIIVKGKGGRFFSRKATEVTATLNLFPVSGLSWIKPIGVQDQLNRRAWTSDRVAQAGKELQNSIGVNELIPPDEFEQQRRLDIWWRDAGQKLPRNVLDQLGIVGGVKVPTLSEQIRLEGKQQVTATKDFLGIERPKSKDPLDALVPIDMDITDPDEPAKPMVIKPEMADILKAASIEDLKTIRSTIGSNPLDFDEGMLRAVEDEIKIKELLPDVIKFVGDRPLTILLGTDFFNTLAFNLPEFTSRKGFSPAETLLDLPKGSESIYIRTVARMREMIATEDPKLTTQVALEMGGVSAELIKFALLPDPSKLRVFSGLSKTAKAAIGVGTRAGLLEVLKAPEVEETLEQRIESVVTSTAIGALTGAVLSKAVDFVKGLPGRLKTAKLNQVLSKKFPQISQEDWTQIIKEMERGNLISLEIKPPIAPARRLVPAGFRIGVAEIEPIKKGIEKVVKAVPKAKEVAAVQAAKTALRLGKQAAIVKPTKILTKKEALSLQESNLVTGEGENIRIVPDVKTQKAIQAKENEIAKLKTRREELKVEKKFAVVKTQAAEIRKKEEALAALKERTGVKLEQTIEGSKAKITKIRAAKEFKDSLRNDAVSMVTAIPKELRADFINRANKVKTLRGLQKLTDEVEVGIEKFDRKIAVGDLRETIKKLESENKLGKVRLGKIPSPQRERMIEIIDEISTKKISKQLEPGEEKIKIFADLDVKAIRGREQLLGTDLKSLQQVTQRLSSELAGGLEALDADTEAALRLPNERVRRLNVLTQKNVDEIDTEDIKLVTQSLQQLAHNSKLKGHLLTKEGFKPLKGAIKTVTENEIATTSAARRKAGKIEAGKPIDVQKGKLKKTAEFGKGVLFLDDAHLDTLTQLATNPNSPVTKQILDTNLHEGHRKSAERLRGWIDDSAKEFERIGFKSTDQITEKVEITLGGKKIKVEKDFLIKLELHSRSPDNLRAILKTEGWQIGSERITYPKDAQGNDLVDRLGELRESLNIVRDDPVLKGIADWTNKLTPDRAEAINEVFRRLHGFDIAREPTYTSRPRVLPRRVEGGKDISVPPELQGQYLPRTGGNRPIRLDKWSDDFLSGIESDASLEMAIPLRNARILVSNAQFQNAMKAAGRDKELQNMITILRRIQGVRTSRSTLEVFGGKLQRGVTTSALGFRVSTIGTQAMSYPAAYAEIDTFMRPMLPVGKDTLARIEEDSALLAIRWKGRRIGVEVGTSASFEAFDTLIFGKAKKLSNVALQQMLKGDKFAIGNIYKQGVVPELLSIPRNGKNVDPFTWEGVTGTVADLPVMNDPDSKAFRYAAARRLEYVVRRTQPVFDMLDRSVSLSNPAIIERQLTIFRTALEAQENSLIRAFDAYFKSPRTFADKKKLAKGAGSVILSAFSVAVWKKGLKWAIGTGATAVLAAFGIHKFDDRRTREDLPKEVAKDTAKNLIRLTKGGKFVVRIGELVADRIAGEGYNWNRNTFDLPVIDVLESGVDAVEAVAQVIADTGMLDEFVEEVTKEDKEFNEQIITKYQKDIENAIRSSYNFGVRIAGAPLLAPVQEFLRPLLVDSKIKIIREVTFGDVESPKKFSERVFSLYEKRTELNNKSKKKRLTREEEIQLATLDRFANQANKLADIAKETEDPELRKNRFAMFEIIMTTTEGRLK